MPEFKLTRWEWDALGSLLLPTSLGGKRTLGPKTGPKLRNLGLAKEVEETLGPGPGDPSWLRVKVKGWQLTQLGQMVYCEWAGRQLLLLFEQADEPRDEEQDERGGQSGN